MPRSAARAVRRANSLRAAEVGVQRGVPAGLASDRPRAARVGAARGRGVVAALAVRQADRVHRRQVEHVEAELRELGQQLLDAGEAAPGAREELVPGAEGRALAVDQRPRASRSETTCSERSPALRRRAPARPSATGRRSSAAPSESSLERSLCPPATLRSSSCCQEATRSTHATTPNCQRPSSSTTNEPCQRSRSSGMRRIGSLAPAALARAAGSARRRRAPRGRRAGTSRRRRRARRACA